MYYATLFNQGGDAGTTNERSDYGSYYFISASPSRSEERGDQKGQCCSASTFEEHD